MANMLDQKINENEELYNSTKKELENIIGKANGEYNNLIKEFNSQASYIQNDNMLTPAGKRQKISEIKDTSLSKVTGKALDYYGRLQKQLDIALLEDEKRKLENYKGLNEKSVPQLMYVNSMVNSISSTKDADLLEDVFKYVCEEGNFSDELINMIYLKARNLINNAVKAESSENEAVNINTAAASGVNRTKVNNIISKIQKYKTDYGKEFTNLKNSFGRAFNQGKYPLNLYMQRDPKNDFRLPGQLDHSNPWNR